MDAAEPYVRLRAAGAFSRAPFWSALARDRVGRAASSARVRPGYRAACAAALCGACFASACSSASSAEGVSSAAGSAGAGASSLPGEASGDSAGGATSSGGSSGASSAAGAGVGGAAGDVASAGHAGAASGGRGDGGSAGSAAAVGNAGSSGSAGGAGGAGGAGQAQVGTPKNPVLPGLYADPQIAQFNGKFYLYPTTDGFANWLSTTFKAFSSTDLVTWKDEGVILDLGPGVTWADDRAWAPGIAFKSGTYYFYFAAAQQIGVAKATSPTGPFKDALGHALVTTGEYGGQSIDPYAFTDDDGRAYLYFGNGSSAHVAELNADMVSFKTQPQAISVPGFREGSVAFKRNGTYYFMWSENDTRSEDYDVAYATGSSPLGPFTKPAGNPILQKNTAQGILGTGHNSVLQLANGDWYIAYHRFAIPNGDGTHREVCLDRLVFNADGSIAPVKPTP
ncbi:MAG: family 43 glycosylhydrolase [Polyangiaceae bacterium]